MTEPSSMTSVTEEDDSSCESDTTETSCSKSSDAMSSFIDSSAEYNTDDKLTSDLVKISLSQTPPPQSRQKRQSHKQYTKHSDSCLSSSTLPPAIQYGCHYLQNNGAHMLLTPRKRQKRSPLQLHPSLQRSNHHGSLFLKKLGLPCQEEENFGIDDPDNYLYTDFSDTSTISGTNRNNNNNNNDTEVSDSSNLTSDQTKTDQSEEEEEDQRPYFPDMTSGNWLKAKCFDRYWSHYSLVMEWYHQHLNAVSALCHQAVVPQKSYSQAVGRVTTHHSGSEQRKRNRNKSRRRARNRRLAKAKRKASHEVSRSKNTNLNQDEDEQFEMEITEDMMDFFAASLKYRMERDTKNKEEEADKKAANGELAGEKAACPVLGPGAPLEQPGLRRNTEMRMLYGTGSPMIQGMETALQMTYDGVLDRQRPALWPNIPLKIVF